MSYYENSWKLELFDLMLKLLLHLQISTRENPEKNHHKNYDRDIKT